MTLEEFLSAVWPDTGRKYLVKLKKYAKHIQVENPREAVEYVALHDTDGNLFFALAGYARPFKDPKGKPKYRTKKQALAAKALWWDIDIGKEGMYQTKREAAAAVLEFCKKVGAPTPILVDSGAGIHVYWPLQHTISADLWESLARRLKALKDQHGIITDPARDTDICSILRPPGALNRKYDPPRRTRILLTADEHWSYEQWDALLPPVAMPFTSEAVDDDALFANLYQGAPADPDLLAQRCNAVKVMAETGGQVLEPHWRAVIGLLKFCENGLEKAHEWSSGDPRYSLDAVEDRFNRWETPPPTCEYIDGVSAACGECQSQGKLTTPLQLARRVPKAAQAPKPQKKGGVKLPPLPKGFTYDSGKLVQWLKVDGTVKPNPLTSTRIHGVKRVRGEDGYSVEFVAINKSNGKLKAEPFTLPTSLIGAGGSELKKELGRFEVFPVNDRKAWSGLVDYLRAEVTRLRESKDETRAFTQFGWHGKEFLLGPVLYTPYGPTDQFQTEGAIEDRVSAFAPKGDAMQWARAIDTVYGVDGMEPMQYAIACSFGSMLGHFMPSVYHGIPVAITGASSGQGKTTTALFACSVFGDTDAMFLNSEFGATHNARNSLMGIYQNIPILIDEITRISSENLSRLLYAISNGADRLRMGSGNGQVKLQATHRWNLTTFLTANTDLQLLLRREKLNSFAESMRIVEVDIDAHSIPLLDSFTVEAALDDATANCGSAGHRFAQWVVENQEKVKPMLNEVMQLLVKLDPRISAGEYRFWRMQAATAFASLLIGHKLGLLPFDYRKLYAWYRRFISTAIDKVQEMNRGNFGEAVNQFILSLNGHTITTLGWRNKEYLEESIQMVRGAIYARQVHNADAHTAFGGKILVLHSWMVEWCNSNRIHPGSFITYTKNKGIVVDIVDNVNIATGTHFTAARGRVIVIDPVGLSLVLGGGANVSVVDTGDLSAGLK